MEGVFVQNRVVFISITFLFSVLRERQCTEPSREGASSIRESGCRRGYVVVNVRASRPYAYAELCQRVDRSRGWSCKLADAAATHNTPVSRDLIPK